MRKAATLAVFASILLAGCLQGAETRKPPPTAEKEYEEPAPWWRIGEYWVVRLEQPSGMSVTGRPVPTEDTFRLVNFWNDTATQHFWLGVSDRNQALAMAIFDTNPFLGRIHHEILAPHEKGMHAGMYQFPMRDGTRWSAFLLGGYWQLLSRESVVGENGERGFAIEGTGERAARIHFDYAPSVRWFQFLEIRDASGTLLLRATVTEHGTGDRGTFHFLRGVDLHRSTGEAISAPGKDETFRVNSTAGFDGLAVSVSVTASGPATVQIVDPNGTVRYDESITNPTGGTIKEITEIPPVVGDWTIKYLVLGGSLRAETVAVGITEVVRTI